MNADVVKTCLASLLMVVGTLLVSSGKVTSDQWGTLNSEIMQAAGACITLGAALYAMWQHKDAVKVAACRRIAGVKVMVNAAVASPKIVAMADDPHFPGVQRSPPSPQPNADSAQKAA